MIQDSKYYLLMHLKCNEKQKHCKVVIIRNLMVNIEQKYMFEM